MSDKIKILAFAGSTRKDSLNKKVIATASKFAENAGAQVTLIDLADYPLPIYDGDLETENGLPENGRKLKDLFVESDALLISTPEYNGSYSAVLKNLIDWMSRPTKDNPSENAFKNKVAGILSCSPGMLGGLNSLGMLRTTLNHLRVLVAPHQFAVSSGFDVFDSDGNITDSKKAEQIEAVCKALVEITQRLK